MERTLTQAQLNKFCQWLRTLNMNFLMKVAEVLDDVLGARGSSKREGSTASASVAVCRP